MTEKVKQLKNSFSVEGVPLIKSDRFTDYEINKMKLENDCHPSHWICFKKGSKIWTDEEIEDQINTMINTVSTNENDLKTFHHKILKPLQLEDFYKDFKIYKTNIYEYLGWDKLTPLNIDFWEKFGSAPFFITEKDRIYPLKQKYGACGMNEIFDDKFDKNYFLIYKIYGFLDSFKGIWENLKKMKKLEEIQFTSPFKNLEDMENNVVYSKIKEESKKFYLDKTKNFQERCKVFDKHGEQEGFIHEPQDQYLKIIFKLYFEENEPYKMSNVDVLGIIEWWVLYTLKNRCKVDWRNEYHPVLIRTERNYKPSQNSIDKLEKRHTEKLFLEGVSNFIFDW